jgi:hypothetical protein
MCGQRARKFRAGLRLCFERRREGKERKREQGAALGVAVAIWRIESVSPNPGTRTRTVLSNAMQSPNFFSKSMVFLLLALFAATANGAACSAANNATLLSCATEFDSCMTKEEPVLCDCLAPRLSCYKALDCDNALSLVRPSLLPQPSNDRFLTF